MAEKSKKQPLKVRIRSARYQSKREKVEAAIVANPHFLSENNGVSALCLGTELSIMSADKGAILNMKYNLPDRILREIVYFAKEYSITKIILFGSRARGTNTERSDIDIAVYGGDFDGFYWDIKEKIHSLLMFDIVQADVSISNELKEEIEKDGVVIYEKA